MNLRKDETLTGVFVIATLVVVVAVLAVLSFPGLIHKQNTYYVFFDNAAGLEPGTQVLLAGRRVGQVVGLQSPVPLAERPEEHEDLETLVEVRVAQSARIYNDVTVRMEPFGMLGQVMVDFVRGDEASGVAAPNTKFVGDRVAGLTDAAEQITQRVEELRTTIKNMNEITGAGGDLRKSAANMNDFTDTIKKQPWRLVWRSTKKYPEDEPDKKDDDHHKKRH